ncbi:MAG: ABC transporter permease [[Clostridium] scindens]
MNSIQMAWRCVLRKPVKSILLLLTVFIIKPLFTRWHGQQKNANNRSFRIPLGELSAPGFSPEENEGKPSCADRGIIIEKIGENKEEKPSGGYYQKKTIINGTENWQSGTDNSFETLLMEDIQKIAENFAGISAYNITTGTMAANPVNFERIADADVDQNGDIQGVSLIGSLDMTMDSNVLSGNLSVKTGRMITGRDSDVCVISEELAAKNSLTIGDNLAFNDCHDREGSAIYEAEIIGIYQTRQKMAPYMSGDTYRSENVIFTDLRFPEKAEGNENNPLFAKAYFKVADVDEYDSIRESIKQWILIGSAMTTIDNHGKPLTRCRSISMTCKRT